MSEERWSKPISQRGSGFTNREFCMATKQISFVKPIGKTDANGNVLKNAHGYVQEWLWMFNLSKSFKEKEIWEKLHGFDESDINRFIQLARDVYAAEQPELVPFDEFIGGFAKDFHPSQAVYTVRGDLLNGYHPPKSQNESFTIFDMMANHDTKKKIQIIIKSDTIIETEKSCFVRRVAKETPEEFAEQFSDITAEVTGELRFYEGKASLSIWAKKVKCLGACSRITEMIETSKEYASAFKDEEAQSHFELPRVKHVAVITGGSAKHPCQGAIDFKKNIYRRNGPRIDYVYVNSNKVSEVIQKLTALDAKGNYDAICIVRGGGDKEDLCQYSSPKLLRAICDASTPIITGVGHANDQLLCDRVADYNASTPTGAANYLNNEINRIRKAEFMRQNMRNIAKQEQEIILADEDRKNLLGEIEELRNENVCLQTKLNELQQQEEKKGFFGRLFHL